MADTGNTTTVTFGTSSFAPTVRSISIGEMTREAIEDSHLATGGQKTFIPSDLVDAGEFTMEIEWDQSAGVFPPVTAAAETVTITFPMKPGQSTTRGTLAGTAFLTSAGGINVANGELMVASVTVKWDGKTEAVFTAGT
jgi:hypothetical protein